MKHPHSREDPTFTRKTFLSENRKSDFFFHAFYVLLHQFRKKSQKTPKREIEKAKTERNDYLRRKETAK